MELREPVGKTFWTRTLVVRRIVVLYARCHNFVQLIELIAVDDLTHLLLLMYDSLSVRYTIAKLARVVALGPLKKATE